MWKDQAEALQTQADKYYVGPSFEKIKNIVLYNTGKMHLKIKLYLNCKCQYPTDKIDRRKTVPANIGNIVTCMISPWPSQVSVRFSL